VSGINYFLSHSVDQEEFKCKYRAMIRKLAWVKSSEGELLPHPEELWNTRCKSF
jgi:hypothetical protein